MQQYSYSRVDLYNKCPYHYKLKYIDNLTEIPDYSANNPLVLGSALHTGIQFNKQKMLDEYFSYFPLVTDEVITESIKLEYMLDKVKGFLFNFSELELIHEYEIDTEEYRGFVDLIIKEPNDECTVVDFKYSNAIDSYMESPQLDIYRYYLNLEGFNVVRTAYLFIDKVNIKRARNEDIIPYRKRLITHLKNARVHWKEKEFNEKNILDFDWDIKAIERETEFEKNLDGKCFICNAINCKCNDKWTPFEPIDYLETLTNENGEIIEMIKLPSIERRDITKTEKRVFWLYGAPFTGKTTFANELDNPLMLNTDGNIKFVDAPFMSIADQVKVNGRVTERTLAWDTFKDIISELEKKDNDFKTIIIDLVEDTYEHCRVYMYEKLGIEHESDNSFKAWDMVRNEFLNVFKRVVHLPYENIVFISHEDTSKDVTKKSGDKITSIAPNLQEKIAKKIAGMVDIVGRVIADGDERKIVFKSKEYVFGGGRLKNLKVNKIPLDVDELIKVYEDANKGLKKKSETLTLEDLAEETKDMDLSDISDTEQVVPYERKSRRRSATFEPEIIEDDDLPPGETAEEPVEEEPKPRRSRRTSESTETSEEEPPKRRERRSRSK